MENWLQTENGVILIQIKAFPGSSRNEFAKIRDNRLCIRVAAAAQDNKANNSLCEFLAKALHCPKRDIVIKKGEKSRIKTISIPESYTEKLKEVIGFPRKTSPDFPV